MSSALRHRDFRLLWLGQTASALGDALVIVAIGIFVTARFDAGDVGLVLGSYALPLVGFLLLGGVVADRLHRRLVMISSDVVRGTAHAVLAVLIATGAVRIWEMVLVGAVYGTAEAFFRPAYTGLTPQTVPEADISSAQGLGSVSAQLAEFVSPALATALLFTIGTASVFAVDAGTFVVSSLLLWRVRPRARGEQRAQTSILRELREGAHAVRERVWVWATIVAFSLALLTALAPFFVLGAQVSRDEYGTAAVYGLANAAWGVGTVAGALVGSRWQPRRPMLWGLLVSVPWPAAVTVFALGPPRVVACLAMTVAGAGIGVFDVWWQTALAQRIPPHLLSRVSAWDWMGSLALLPLGYVVSGQIAALVGARTVLVVGGVAGSAVTALALLPRGTRELRRLPRAAPEPVMELRPALRVP